MIVKNESRIIERCLDSAKPIISLVSIVDTGSTDNTVDLIKNWLSRNNMKGTVHHEPFRDFGYNRTHSFDVAKSTYPEATYFLLLDADMVLEIGKDFNKNFLFEDKYMIEQYDKENTYWNVRLISSRQKWVCYCVTHEYWALEGEIGKEIVKNHRINTLKIDDRTDGGCKSDKWIRDKRLLLGEVNNPKVKKELLTRYKFYLAQTLMSLGEHDESIHWYKSRISDGGWQEEIYYSMLNIGVNYETIGWNKYWAIKYMEKASRTPDEEKWIARYNNKENSCPENNNFEHLTLEELKKVKEAAFNSAGTWYTDAWKYRPTRAESLQRASKMYREVGMNEVCLEIALKGKEITFPEQDTLFVSYPAYDYLFDYDISIAAFYVPGKEHLGRESLALLVGRDDLPEFYINSIRSNAKHYL